MPPNRVLFDAWFLEFFVAAAEPAAAVRALRRVVRGKAFRVALRQAVRAVLRRYPALAGVTFTLRR